MEAASLAQPCFAQRTHNPQLINRQVGAYNPEQPSQLDENDSIIASVVMQAPQNSANSSGKTSAASQSFGPPPVALCSAALPS